MTALESLLLRAINNRVLLAGAAALAPFPLPPLDAVVDDDVGVATDDDAQLRGVQTVAVVVVVVVITVLLEQLVVLLLLFPLQFPLLLLAHVAAAEAAGVLLVANPEALVAGTGELGILYGGVAARLLNGCIRLLTEGGLFDGVPIGPFDMKLGDGLGAGTVLLLLLLPLTPLALAPPPPPPPELSASRLVGVGGILFKTPPAPPDGAFCCIGELNETFVCCCCCWGCCCEIVVALLKGDCGISIAADVCC